MRRLNRHGIVICVKGAQDGFEVRGQQLALQVPRCHEMTHSRDKIPIHHDDLRGGRQLAQATTLLQVIAVIEPTEPEIVGSWRVLAQDLRYHRSFGNFFSEPVRQRRLAYATESFNGD